VKHILALDQGTTSSRAIVFDRSGHIVSVAQREFRQIFPHPGWVEHDAQEIWTTQLKVASQALRKAGLTAGDIAAIGITNQRETTAVWDRATGRPVCNAIVWQDRRTAPGCDRLKARGLAPAIRRKTGLVVDAYFSATKLQWILNHVPGAKARAQAGELAFGTIDSWLVWNLTNGRCHVTDPSNASRTMLFNIHTGAWDEELLRIFGVPRAVLPAVCSSSEVYGATNVFGGEIPVAGIAGDQQAALFDKRACVSDWQAEHVRLIPPGQPRHDLLQFLVIVIASRHPIRLVVKNNRAPRSRIPGHEAQDRGHAAFRQVVGHTLQHEQSPPLGVKACLQNHGAEIPVREVSRHKNDIFRGMT